MLYTESTALDPSGPRGTGTSVAISSITQALNLVDLRPGMVVVSISSRMKAEYKPVFMTY